MLPRLRDAIVLGRTGSRERGVQRLLGEADSMGVELAFPPLAGEFARDWIRADRLSKSYTSRWLRKAEALDSPTAASLETRGSLERTAITESSEAFSAGRAAALDSAQLYEHGGGDSVRVVSETSLMKAWDATLDNRVCEICEGADGTVVGINETFPAGEPGGVHAWCRCSWQLVRVTFRG